MDPLAEMHLLLREAGWAPRYDDEEWDCWYWYGPGPVFVTMRDPSADSGVTCEELRSEEAPYQQHTLDALQRLTDFATVAGTK
jgi:hypothetical protein